MRVTAKVKQETRDRISEAAHNLFATKGFDATTTRDIASRAGIAVGTLFNYFASKEALGMAIVGQALESARAAFAGRRRGDEPLAELLFALVMSELRALQPHRSFVGQIFESAMSPFAAGGADDAGGRVRAAHLEMVADLMAQQSGGATASFVGMHLYWTLYLGVLAFWSDDDSPNQEDTLVVLDQSLQLFVQSLSYNSQVKEVADGT